MKSGLLYSTDFLAHTQRNHPESADRLHATMRLLEREHMLDRVDAIPFRAATSEQLACVHDRAYIDGLERFSAHGGGMLGPDTYVNQASFYVASLAAGASMAAVSAVMSGDLRRAFALVRPPGHHAFADHGEGFCLFNNVAIAAHTALGCFGNKSKVPLDRIMIVDWDVHHGNGTEAIFYADPRVLYISTHQVPLYPGTGSLADVGEGPGHGTNVNIALPPGVGDNGYARVFDEIVFPLARRYRPQLILMSAGFDAHWRDLLANMKVSLAGFANIVATMSALSDELCGGRIVAVLEGGYDLEVLSYGVLNTFQVMNGDTTQVIDPVGAYTGAETPVDRIIARVKQLHHL